MPRLDYFFGERQEGMGKTFYLVRAPTNQKWLQPRSQMIAHDGKAKPAATTHTSTPVVSETMAADGIEKSGQGTNEQLWEEVVAPESPKITHATRNSRDFIVNESTLPNISANHYSCDQGTLFSTDTFDASIKH